MQRRDGSNVFLVQRRDGRRDGGQEKDPPYKKFFSTSPSAQISDEQARWWARKGPCPPYKKFFSTSPSAQISDEQSPPFQYNQLQSVGD
ncbi:MAG: hypothetical protein KAI83_18550 [Thiomargarita sp.]|nr:hypothetical protein [Thiomargarita sp.]